MVAPFYKRWSSSGTLLVALHEGRALQREGLVIDREAWMKEAKAAKHYFIDQFFNSKKKYLFLKTNVK